jgi:hypothetical protein
MAVDLSVWTNTGLDAALGMASSEVRDAFASQQFAARRKMQEHENKLAIAVLNRIDNVAKAIGNLGKSLAGRR